MAKKYARRDMVGLDIASAGLVTLETERVPQGWIYCWQQVAWETDTAMSGGNTRARLYIKGRGYKHYLEEQGTPTAAVLYTYNKSVYLVAGEQLALDLDQAQAASRANIFLTGYALEFAEGVS